MKVRQLNKKEKIMGAVILFLLFAFFLKTLIIYPVLDKFNSINQDISRSGLLIRKYQELEKQRSFLLEEHKKIEPYLKLKGTQEEKLAVVLSKIESEAAKAGITIVDMKPDTSGRLGPAKSVYRILLNAEADIAKIFSFLYSLENADILLKVDKLQLTLKDENTGIIKLEARILGVVIS